MENKNKYYFIYKTTNLKNGKFYIGAHSTNNLNDGYLGSGKVLRNSVYYHGKENFKREIIEFYDNNESMFQKEKELVTEELIKEPKCMNLKVGGSGGAQPPEKQRNWILAGSKGFSDRMKNDDDFRKKITNHLILQTKENHKKGIYNYNTFSGKTHTNETKRKMSLKASKRTGNKNSQYGTCWITNDIENKKICKYDKIPDGWKLGRKMNNTPS